MLKLVANQLQFLGATEHSKTFTDPTGDKRHSQTMVMRPSYTQSAEQMFFQRHI